MAVVLVISNTIWQVTGLSDRGLAFTIVQVGSDALIGVIVFVVVAHMLKMSELELLLRPLNRLLRRNQVEKALP